MIKQRQLAQNSVLSFGSELVARAGALGTLAIFILLGDPAQAGSAVTGVAYAMTAWLLLDVGLGYYGTREVAAQPCNADLLQDELTLTRLSLAVIVVPALTAINAFVLQLEMVSAVGFAAFIGFRAGAGDWRLRAESRFGALLLINAVASIAQLTTAFAVLMLQPTSVALPWVVWSLILLIGCWHQTQMNVGRLVAVRVVDSLRHLKKSVHFALSNGATVLFGQLPLLYLSLLLLPEEIAGFGFAHRLAIAANIVSQSIAVAFFPRLVSSFDQNSLDSVRLARSLTGLSIAASTVVAISVTTVVVLVGLTEQLFPMAERSALILLAIFVIARGAREAGTRTLFAQRAEQSATSIIGVNTALVAGVYTVMTLTDSLNQVSAASIFLGAELVVVASLLWRSSIGLAERSFAS